MEISLTIASEALVGPIATTSFHCFRMNREKIWFGTRRAEVMLSRRALGNWSLSRISMIEPIRRVGAITATCSPRPRHAST